MVVHIDRQVEKNCWNLYDSYGEICINCGCCSRNKTERYVARISCLKDWILERENFNMWNEDPKWRKLQEENIKSDIKYFKRKLRYYEKKLNEH